MVFSSTIFLFFFLPLVLLGYLLVGSKGRNLFLLLASLLFYAWGENFYLLIMLVSIGMNWLFGLLINNAHVCGRNGNVSLVVAVVANLGLLGFFKYANFFVDNLNAFLSALQIPLLIEIQPVHLPIGISFFTFQALSYVLDLHRRETTVQKNLLKFALYKSLFPQLIAGPIIRYKDVALEIEHRTITLEDFAYGARRFIIGLGKKVLIANVLGRSADYIFSLPADRVPASLAWLGAIAYTLQIYYDFSGYSDMAIGLGRMFGFHFLENFNYPYISRSIKEFWRRWHISLSSWFRDYVYIPMGGSKGGPIRTYFNLFTIFFLCGLWHGASWTFVIWGLYHGSFLVLERTVLMQRLLEKMPNGLRHLYVCVVVIVGWVFFRADTMAHAIAFLSAMVRPGTPELFNSQIFLTINREFYLVLVLAIIGSAPLAGYFDRLRALLNLGQQNVAGWIGARTLASVSFLFLGFVLLYSIASILGGAHNPFLYFRF